MADWTFGLVTTLVVGSAAFLYFWWKVEENGASALECKSGGRITIGKNSTFTVNGKEIHVPPGTYTSGLTVNQDGAFIDGKRIDESDKK